MSRLLPACLAICQAAAMPWTTTVLQTFTKPGANPTAPLVRGADGGLYGTSSSGGAAGVGTLFRVESGKVLTIHHFGAAGGSAPAAGMVVGGDGALYGTTDGGGAGGFGAVFRFDPATGTLATLFNFAGGNGSVPAELAWHGDGNFYGVTRAGGANGHGTLFKLTPGGTLTTLHSFTGTDGSDPCGPLEFAGGSFYGVCRSGGSSSLGTAFRITPGGTFTPLFSFSGNAGAHPGANPAAGLRLHSSGVLVGTTEYGGSAGFGTAFKLTTAAVPVHGVLHHFADPTGSQPAGRLVEGADANLYGTCAAGGTAGFGVLFRLTPGGIHTPLHQFSGNDGAVPRAGLVEDAGGLFHGTTSAGGPGQLGVAFTLSSGGAFAVEAVLSPGSGFLPSGAPVADGTGRWLFPLARGGDLGGGTIAAIDPDTGELTSHALDPAIGDTPDGALSSLNGVFYGICARGGLFDRGSAFVYDPLSGPAALADFDTAGGSLAEGPLVPLTGALFGMAREGGSSVRGTLYRLSTTGSRLRVLSFTGTTGSTPGRDPRGPLVLAPNQSLYGTTALGGSSNLGVVFKINALGAYTQLASFTSTGPNSPGGGLVLAADGMIYGSCRSGGDSGAGALIRIDPATDQWETAASFDPASSEEPLGPLLASDEGFIFGLTAGGAVFRFHPLLGLEIVADTGAAGAAEDESALAHTGGLALLPDRSLLCTLPAGGPGGGGQVVRIVPPAPRTAWKLAQLGDAQAPDTGDPDGDSLPNLVEYALGLDPAVPDALPAAALVSGALEVTLARDPARTDVAVSVEATSDLEGPWETLASTSSGLPYTGPGYVSGDAATPSLKAVRIRDTLSPPSAPRRFLRLRVDP
ncbi:choice-of-anchor tandem repeat GloVer-containing protein [Haloferula sargassicola]|uniref:choice-of-anchor tandem repeat GloVer-containing protein n=1 Tax=Haloferula sargassicola TaxID=490096 RepID=UPI0033654F65